MPTSAAEGIRIERKFALKIAFQNMLSRGNQACSIRARPIPKRTLLGLFLPFGSLPFLLFFLFPFLQL
jgi:hypothetical protein